jgi:hypothetical protein
MVATRRLRSLLSHVTGGGGATPASPHAADAAAGPPQQQPPKLLDDSAVKSFIMKGWMSITPEEVGLPRSFMQTIYDKMSALHDDSDKKIGENSHSAVPEIHDVMAQPAVAGALQSLLGKGYSLHPHTFTHIKDDVGSDQDWHKDGFLPRNGHGIRYHQPEHGAEQNAFFCIHMCICYERSLAINDHFTQTSSGESQENPRIKQAFIFCSAHHVLPSGHDRGARRHRNPALHAILDERQRSRGTFPNVWAHRRHRTQPDPRFR